MQGIEPPYTDPYVRWCERSTSQLMASLLLDWGNIECHKISVQKFE